jgi:hypothetical protein
MKYEKPQVVEVGSALASVHSASGKGNHPTTDMPQGYPTNGAYEADE